MSKKQKFYTAEFKTEVIKAIEEKNDGRFNYNSDNEELTWAK